ncbi:MAG TPA: hypothetical protein VGM90_14345 [Kofleriaceae bacterium]
MGRERDQPADEPVEQIATTGRIQADEILAQRKQHGGDRTKLITALAHPGLGHQ